MRLRTTGRMHAIRSYDQVEQDILKPASWFLFFACAREPNPSRSWQSRWQHTLARTPPKQGFARTRIPIPVPFHAQPLFNPFTALSNPFAGHRAAGKQVLSFSVHEEKTDSGSSRTNCHWVSKGGASDTSRTNLQSLPESEFLFAFMGSFKMFV